MENRKIEDWESFKNNSDVFERLNELKSELEGKGLDKELKDIEDIIKVRFNNETVYKMFSE